jgi:hypothetical protein
MELRTTCLVAALALGACAGSKKETTPESDPYFTLPLVAGAGTTPFPDVAHAVAFQVQVSVERVSGSRVAAPALIVQPGQLASVVVGQDVPEDAKSAAPNVADGLQLSVCVAGAADGGATIGFRATLTKSRKDGSEIERAEVSGTRWIEPGVVGMLARLTSPDGSGPLIVLARVTPMERGMGTPPAASDVKDPIQQPMTGHTVHLRVSSAQIGRDFDPGTVVDETAAPDVMQQAGGRVLHDFEVFSCLDRRVHLAGLVGSGAGERGFVAEGGDDGRLHVSWKTTGATQTATIHPNRGRRFVAIARVEGGGTAGAIVSVDAD